MERGVRVGARKGGGERKEERKSERTGGEEVRHKQCVIA